MSHPLLTIILSNAQETVSSAGSPGTDWGLCDGGPDRLAQHEGGKLRIGMFSISRASGARVALCKGSIAKQSGTKYYDAMRRCRYTGCSNDLSDYHILHTLKPTPEHGPFSTVRVRIHSSYGVHMRTYCYSTVALGRSSVATAQKRPQNPGCSCSG